MYQLISKEHLARPGCVFATQSVAASRATSRAIVPRWLLVSGALVIRSGLWPGSASTPGRGCASSRAPGRNAEPGAANGPSKLLGPEGQAASRSSSEGYVLLHSCQAPGDTRNSDLHNYSEDAHYT